MEDGKEVVAGEDTSANTEVTQEVTTPTPEEQLKMLQAQLNDTLAQKTKAEEGYKNLQRTLNKTNEELKRQSEVRGDIESLNSRVKIIAALLAEKGNIAEENLDSIPQGRRQDLLKQFETEEAQRKQKAKAEEYSRLADGLYEQAKELKMPKRDLWAVEDALRNGLPNRAEELIQEYQEQSKEKETMDVRKADAPKESDEERINRLAEEKVNEILKKKNLLQTDKIAPSGGSGNRLKLKDIAEYSTAGKTTKQIMDDAREAIKQFTKGG